MTTTLQIENTMNELKELINDICKDLQECSALLAERSKELERREAFDREFDRELEQLKESINNRRK